MHDVRPWLIALRIKDHMVQMNLQFDRPFVEESVFQVISKGNIARVIVEQFHSDREGLYLTRMDERDTDAAFKKLYEGYFLSTGLLSFFGNIVKEFLGLHQDGVSIFIKGAHGCKEECSELFIRQDKEKTVCIGLMAERVLDQGFLSAFLRHELLRSSDMLDPRFQYASGIDLGGKNEMEEDLVRERFGLLWDFYIDIRLRKRGSGTLKPLEKYREIFERKFFFLSHEDRNKILSKLEGCEELMQIDLLDWAGNDRSRKILGEGGLRCPICDFTSFQSADCRPGVDPKIIEDIKRDHPHWDPSQGICHQCLEMYGSHLNSKVFR